MELWNAAIDAVQWTPTSAYAKCAPPPTPACAAGPARRLLVAVMFSFEVDMLQVALEQYHGVADVLLAESTAVHNMHERRSKPLLWRQLRSRFRQYNVSSVTCPHVLLQTGMKKKGKWDAEGEGNTCLSNAIRERIRAYDVVVVGSVDEILGRAALMRLRHCPLPPLPTSSAIGMPLGLLGRKFRSDWHYSERPYSFSLPSIYPASYQGPFVRSFRPIGPVPVVGGLHATNYCFLPNIVLKDLTGTSYAHTFTSRRLCKRSVQHWKSKCYAMLSHRVQRGASEETEVPCALSTTTYPAWNGSIDERERRFWNRSCSNSNFSNGSVPS